jgi:hypothetical protein
MRAVLRALFVVVVLLGVRADIIPEVDDEPPAQPPIVQRNDGSFSGYLTDIYCWELPGRVAIDGAEMLKRPDRHTVHCMVDIPECINSGYGVLDKPEGASEYTLKYKLDAAGNAMALNLLRASSKRRSYIVSVKGVFSGDSVEVREIFEYVEDTGAVEKDMEARMPDVGASAPGVIVAHFVLMLVACAALSLGVALAANGKTAAADGAWLVAHRRLQIAGLMAMLGGFACALAFAASRGAHFKSAHTFIGIAVIALTLFQPAMAALRPKAAHGKKKSDARALWETAHKVVGYLTLAGAVAAIATGTSTLAALGYGAAAWGAAVGLFLAGLVPLVVYFGMAKMGHATETTRLLVVNLSVRAAHLEPAPAAVAVASGP